MEPGQAERPDRVSKPERASTPDRASSAEGDDFELPLQVLSKRSLPPPKEEHPEEEPLSLSVPLSHAPSTKAPPSSLLPTSLPPPSSIPTSLVPSSRGEEPAYSIRPSRLPPEIVETAYPPRLPRPSDLPPPPTPTGSYSQRPPPPARPVVSLPPPGITKKPPEKSAAPPTRAGARDKKAREAEPPSSRTVGHRAGRVVAFVLCVVFAIIGFVPVFAAALVRTKTAKTWAAKETAAILDRELGTRATYDVDVRLWPLTITIQDVVVEADDGGSPFLTVERASLRPRIFSLLGGKVNVGQVEVTGARARVVVRDGEIVNFKPKTPESKAKEEKSDSKPPFHAVSITDAAIDLDIDGTRIELGEVDLDAAVEADGTFELGARAGRGALTRLRADPRHPEEQALDEDRLCHLEARARLDPANKALLVRRLEVGAVADFDPGAGTRPSCSVAEEDWRKIEVSLGAVEVPASVIEGKGFSAIAGRVGLRVPAALAHRFVALPNVSGAVRVDLEAVKNPDGPLPFVSGHVRADMIGLDGKIFSDRADLDFQLEGTTIAASKISARWADGDFTIASARVALGDPHMRLDARTIVADGVTIQGILRDLGVHPQSHVGWEIRHVELEQFAGTIVPLDLSGKLVAHTESFGVYDRPSHRDDKKALVHEDRADIKGVLAVRATEVAFEKMHVATPRSNLTATVKLGFEGAFGLDVAPGSVVDLEEIGPISGVRIVGRTTLAARGSGPQDAPRIEGDLKVDGFELGNIRAGDIRRSHVVFSPLHMDFTDLELAKNGSIVTSAKTSVAFDAGPSVLVDADVMTTTAPYLKLGDFFEVFQLDRDPRFKQVAGTAIGSGRVHYVIDGAEDRCGGGVIDVRTRMDIDRPELFGESFEKGAIDMHFRWDDLAAGAEGMEIHVASATVQDATGSITAQADISHGGVLRGTAIAAGLSLSKLESLGALRDHLDGEVSAIATLGGTLSRPAADIDVSVGPLRFGANKMPGSRATVRLEADPTPPIRIGTSVCGLPISPPSDPSAPDTDAGRFRVDGKLFDGQVVLDGVTIEQRRLVRGRVALVDLNVGTLLGGLPFELVGSAAPEAKLSADIDIAHLDTSSLGATEASIDLKDISVSRSGRTIKLTRTDAPIRVRAGNVELPEVGMDLVDKSGLSIAFSARGRVLDVFQSEPRLDVSLAIAPFDLGTLRDDLPSVDRIGGMVSGAVDIGGTLSSPQVTGYAKLRDGFLAITNVPVPLDDIAVDVVLGDGELRVTKATANVGAGRVDVTGRVPIVGLGLGSGTATITARGVKLPVGDDIDVVADADLTATIPATSRTDGSLPEARGTVSLTSFLYKRPIALSVDLGELSRNIGRTEVEAYDPANDFLRFSLRVVSPRPLVVRNDLADVRLEIVEPGIELSGTNQRYGAKGALRLLSDSKIRLRNHEFDVREGYVRFNDPTKVKAEIDVRATTDMRRYASAQDSASADASTSSTSSSTTAGQWDVSIHAHGSTEDLKLDLSSDPPMDQEDIVLLLTVGMTRAEMDRALATSLGETVGLEALSALTGADKAVKSVVPIIDYFHFGSSYSSRTGRTEPNVTVGKRLNDDLRASVTTTLTEREVAATVEWRLKKGVSIQASYDNTNDIGTIIGNLGADLRWRLEFE